MSYFVFRNPWLEWARKMGFKDPITKVYEATQKKLKILGVGIVLLWLYSSRSK